MNQEHLTYFKVENFKRFDSLELSDIGQFNLIVGDNNVGKTSLLEALLFERDRVSCLGKFHKTLILKGIHLLPKRIYGSKGEVTDIVYPSENFLMYLVKDIDKKIFFQGDFGNREEYNIVEFGMSDFEEWKLYQSDRFENQHTTFLGTSPDSRYIIFHESWGVIESTHIGQDYSEEVGGLYSHCLSQDPKDILLPLILVSPESKKTLSDSYFDFVSLSRQAKKQLIEEIKKTLISDIEDFEVRKIGGEDQLLVGVKNRDEMAPVSTFGDSVTRAIQILLEIHQYQGKRLMIDEIDTGIHYSRMKKFLKTVFQVALKNDVQLFMTTHSLECQQAFAEVFEDVDMAQHKTKARQYTLLEKANGQVVASVRDFEQLESALETGYDTRGGKR